MRTLPPMMWYRAFAIFLGFCGILAFGNPLPGEEAKESPAEQRMLVLRNGQALEGQISQENGLYIVRFTDGEIRIKSADVDVICNSLEDGYQRKRAAIGNGNVHEHLELAQWCLHHRLYEFTKRELADATAADPSHPMIAVLRNRLEIAMEPPAKAGPTRKSKAGPSNEDLDRMIRALPHDVVEEFSQSVQPVLMNHCAASDCHGTLSGNAMQFLRVPVGKTSSRRITQRNLYSALTYIDRNNIGASPLLSTPLSPHGDMKHAVFTEHEAAQYKRLVQWVSRLSQQPIPETPATLPPNWLNQTQPPQVLTEDAKQAQPMPMAAGQSSPNVHRGAASMREKLEEATQASFSGDNSDPFDPEAFNRRHSPKKTEKTEQIEATEP